MDLRLGLVTFVVVLWASLSVYILVEFHGAEKPRTECIDKARLLGRQYAYSDEAGCIVKTDKGWMPLKSLYVEPR